MSGQISNLLPITYSSGFNIKHIPCYTFKNSFRFICPIKDKFIAYEIIYFVVMNNLK